MPRQARDCRQHGVAAERRRLDVDQHALDARLAADEHEHLPRALLEQLQRVRDAGFGTELHDRQAAYLLVRGVEVVVVQRLDVHALGELLHERRVPELLRGTVAGRDEPQAADRRRQRVHVLEADVNVLTQGERHRFDVARAARSLDRKRLGTGALRARERVGRRHLEPQPLAGADEFHIDDLAGPDDGHAQQIAQRREHDVLGAHDDGRLVTTAQPFGPAVDLEIRFAEPHVAIAVGAEQQIGAAQELGHEPRAGALVERARLADLLQPASVHDADAVGHAEGFFLVVRDEHRRDTDGSLNLANGAPQLLANFRVERTERLVEQQHARLVRERARECDALLLAARQLARQAMVVTFERNELQQLRAPPAPLSAAHAAGTQRELDVVGHRHVAKQRVVLEHEADFALPRPQVRDIAAVQHDAAMIDRRETRNGAQQRALAAARRAEQHEQLAVLDLRRDITNGRQPTEFLGNLLESDRHGVAASALDVGTRMLLGPG